MPRLYIRIIANRTGADEILSALHGLDCVERVEEVAALMSGVQDDSSSAHLSDDVGPGIHTLEVEVGHLAQTDRVRRVAEVAATQSAATVEFVREL